ncbi:unnamed protein product [Vicia faba]|uniref:Tf2-1-like SH3-like domain-containing protein n=1 Tax=Vicia faba TaxID=3906 RepID=A0AAV1BCL2_VICFA|nr:unnamed protein product [Vicia faba]
MYLKLQPYTKVSMKQHAIHKLLPKFCGPFLIQDHIGSTAYQLKRPPYAAIHNIFHVSQLNYAQTLKDKLFNIYLHHQLSNWEESAVWSIFHLRQVVDVAKLMVGLLFLRYKKKAPSNRLR